ncbi:MAG: hypothetical protein KF832_02960 [Caldilineaceae bacterium]|nr:hypothetical protein [Caldilineaceae bacterium]
MTDQAATDREPPRTYQLRLQGQLGVQWATWFDGLAISHTATGDTLLTGLVADQAALYGLLRKVRDLGLPLLACICLDLNGEAK